MELGSLAWFLIVSVLFVSDNAKATKEPSPVCLIRNLGYIAALQGDLCYPHLIEDNCTPRALQVSGPDAPEAVSLLSKARCVYYASLFYAESCPFSRSTRQMFDQLSILFPDICHLAVESSSLWPSELSEFGVRSLPTLVLHNKTSRFQFYGRRYLETLSHFYEEKTGFVPVPLKFFLGEVGNWSRRQAEAQGKNWKIQLTSWIWDDFYLTFAIFFVVLRSFLYVQPKVVATFRHYWLLKGMPSRALVGRPIRGPAEQRKRRRLAVRRNNGKYLRKDERESGKGLLSLSSWPSSSLAAVTLGECSSRGVPTEDSTKKPSGA